MKAKKKSTKVAEPLLTASEAATLIGLTKRTIHDHVAEKRLPVAETIMLGAGKKKMFRFKREDVLALKAALRPDGHVGPGRPRLSDRN